MEASHCLQLIATMKDNTSINSSGAHSPRATAGHLLTLSVAGLGHLKILSRPGGCALAYPGATPGHLTHVFSPTTPVSNAQVSLSGRTRTLSNTGLSVRDDKNLLMLFKVCLLNFRYFFITCKHVNISDKVNYILFITKTND